MTKQRSRFTREDISKIALTERDVEILQAVHRNRFLSSRQIIQLFARSPQNAKRILHRLQKLYHHQYLDRPASQLHFYPAGGSRPLIYGMTHKSQKFLKQWKGSSEKNIESDAAQFFLAHTLEVADFMIGLEAACQCRSNARILYPEEILSTVSGKIKRQRNPLSWETHVAWQNDEHTIWIVPDKIFGLATQESRTGKWRLQHFFLEVDRGTMPVSRSKLKQTSILRKLLSYATTQRQRLHETLYNMNNVRVLTVTTGQTRIDNILETHKAQVAGQHKPGLFLFTTWASITKADNLFNTPWVNDYGKTVRPFISKMN